MSVATPTADAGSPVAPVSEQLVAIPYRRVSAAAVVVNIVLVLLGAFFLLPMLWMLFASIDSNPDWAVKLPSPTFANFVDVFHTEGAVRSFQNSLYLAGVTTIVTTTLAVLAAYPLSRRHIPLKRSVMLVILFASGLPVTMLLVPVYQLYVTLEWLNSLFTTALFLSATSLPFAIWLMKNFIDAVPMELEHAAAIDGAGTLRILARVVLPLSLPGISVTAIYTFIQAWGAFIVPLILDSNPNDIPGPIEIYNFMGSHGFFNFGALAVFSLLFSVPVVVLYLIMSRWFSGAFNFSGAIRG